MRKPVLTGADEKRVQSMFDRVQWQETELPIGRMIATQPTVNPDFAETLSSQDLLPTVVQKGNELFVRDGHHRLVRAAEAGNTKAKVALLNLDPPTDAPLLDYRAPAPWSAEDDALLAELYDTPPVAPMKGVGGSMEEALQVKYPGVKLSISGDAERGFTLNRIEIPKSERSSGIGTKVMRDLTAMADASGATVRLSPSGDFGGSPARLRDFYKRFGFVDNAGKNKDFGTRETMLRAPAIKPIAPMKGLLSGPQ
jgi:GNAT superfamily N-acetyltransferase